MASDLTYIEVNNIIASYKEDKTKTEEETLSLIANLIGRGVEFNGVKIKITICSRDNGLLKRKQDWYYFLCPKCEKMARKIYRFNGVIGCRTCLKIKRKFKVKTQADRVLKIQTHLSSLFNGGISAKQKERLIGYVVHHYGKLDEKYKMAYNTFIFKSIQNWCLDSLLDKNKEIGYKKAIKDILKILRESSKILTRTNLFLK